MSVAVFAVKVQFSMVGLPPLLYIPAPSNAVFSVKVQFSMVGLPPLLYIPAPCAAPFAVKIQFLMVGLPPLLYKPPPCELAPPLIVKPSRTAEESTVLHLTTCSLLFPPLTPLRMVTFPVQFLSDSEVSVPLNPP